MPTYTKNEKFISKIPIVYTATEIPEVIDKEFIEFFKHINGIEFLEYHEDEIRFYGCDEYGEDYLFTVLPLEVILTNDYNDNIIVLDNIDNLFDFYEPYKE